MESLIAPMYCNLKFPALGLTGRSEVSTEKAQPLPRFHWQINTVERPRNISYISPPIQKTLNEVGIQLSGFEAE